MIRKWLNGEIKLTNQLMNVHDSTIKPWSNEIGDWDWCWWWTCQHQKKSLAQEVSPHKHAHPYCLYQYLNNLKQFVSCPMSEHMEASFKQGFYRFQSTESQFPSSKPPVTRFSTVPPGDLWKFDDPTPPEQRSRVRKPRRNWQTLDQFKRSFNKEIATKKNAKYCRSSAGIRQIC